jgi:hypothetical protein
MFPAKKEDLGWDYSMVRVAPNIYRIRIDKDWYETKKMLSSFPVDGLNGHAGRSWFATVVEDEEEQGTGTACQSGAIDNNTEKGAISATMKNLLEFGVSSDEAILRGKTVDKFSYCMVLTTYTAMYRYRIMKWKYSKFGREVRHSSIFNRIQYRKKS